MTIQYVVVGGNRTFFVSTSSTALVSDLDRGRRPGSYPIERFCLDCPALTHPSYQAAFMV